MPIITHTISEDWHFLGAFGPAISAFVVSFLIKGNAGISGLKDKIIKYRVGFRWIIVALSPIFLLLISWPIGYFIFNGTRGSVLMTIIWHVLWNLVAVLDMTKLSSIMSAIMIMMAILIILKFGTKNLSPNEKIWREFG